MLTGRAAGAQSERTAPRTAFKSLTLRSLNEDIVP